MCTPTMASQTAIRNQPNGSCPIRLHTGSARNPAITRGVPFTLAAKQVE